MTQDFHHFQNYILEWYKAYGRTHLPWRQTTDPYHILVSELMLQQTQVERVIPKYNAFLSAFSSVEDLALQPLSEVLKLWQGLGYNRRAKFLHQTAKHVHEHLDDTFPTTIEGLQALPGVGSYTASAIMTFAFNQPVTVIETNIRAVYIYHFFPNKDTVSDAEILPKISSTLYISNPRIWYSALMDYGSHLKKIMPNPSKKSKHYTLQSPFQNSPRRVRGEIIRYLSYNPTSTITELEEQITGNKQFYLLALENLEKEGMIIRDGDTIKLGE